MVAHARGNLQLAGIGDVDFLYLTVPEGVLALSATTTGGAAVTILGLAATIAAIKICLKSKSTKVLKKLRENYIMVSNNNGIIKLQRK